MARESVHCTVLPCRNNEFEVKEGAVKFAVKLEEKTCSCKWWEISGLPCKHAVKRISHNRLNVEDFCHEYYNISKYVDAYSGIIHPYPEIDLEPEDDTQIIQPIELKRKPGRPKKKRVREEGEEPAEHVRTRTHTVKCKKCGERGHNSRTCIGGRSGAGNEGGNGRGRGGTSQAGRSGSMSEASRGSERGSQAGRSAGRGRGSRGSEGGVAVGVRGSEVE